MPPKILILNSTSLFHKTLSSPPPPLLPLPLTNIPKSKLIPNTRFLIDAFRFASSASSHSYFLTHFHSDHYSPLSSSWSHGIIYCSPITARLLTQILKIPSSFVVSLPMSETVIIDLCEVTLVDANHCPGAVQFLFRVPIKDGNGKFERYVHTGDFRFCDEMKGERVLHEFIGADCVFLDTTYCDPKFVFPRVEECVEYIVGVIERVGGENEGVLFLVATYVVGKERILVEIARRCKRKLFVDGRKMGVLRVLGFEDGEVFTEDERESHVHVVGWNMLGETWPYFRPNFVAMKEIMVARGYSKVVGFVPTGWTYVAKGNKFSVRTKESFEIHLVPYSEHSNYEELREYVKFLKPKRVTPTVGVDVEKLDRKHSMAIQKHFAGLIDEMAIKEEFLMGFHRGVQESDDKVGKDLLVNQETASADVQTVYIMDVVDIVNCTTRPDQDSDPKDLVSVNDDVIEEMLQELRDCLPTWVTRDQMLDLLRSSSRDVVAAVSNFYEHETKFYEQVVGSASSGSTSRPSSVIDSSLPSNLDTGERAFFRVDCSPSNLSFKPLGTRTAAKVNISPAKTKRNFSSKSNKKARTNSTQELNGPKQYTITKFFSKVEPCGSQDIESGTLFGSPKDKGLSTDSTLSYKEEVEQFMQIVNASESKRNYAATMIEQTKGDINKALNMYYGDLDGNLNQKMGSSVMSSEFVKDQSHVGILSSDQGAKESKKLLKMNNMSAVTQPDGFVASNVVASTPSEYKANMSVPEQSTDDVVSHFVSLASQDYSPVEHACWKDGQPAPYLHLARTLDLVEEEKGKIKATSILCNMFRSLLALSPEDVVPAVYLCTNKIAPDHEKVELNIGGSIVVSALEEACGTNKSRIRDLYNSLGDLGDVAQLCRQTQSLLAPPAPLSIRGVFSVLWKMSVHTGSGSTNRKKSLIVNLMRSCREKEMKFLVRTLVRNLRVGAMIKTVLTALAQAIVMNSSRDGRSIESMKDQIQDLSAAVIEAYNCVPSLDLLVPSLLEHGIKFSSITLPMVPGIPIKPMLAKITNGVSQVLKLFQNKAFTCEYKYDGQRAQIHKLSDGSVHVFSRNGDETTSRFPDLVCIMQESFSSSVATFVLDAEIVAVDRKHGCKLMSFQELSSRERGGKDSLVSVDSIKVDICVFVFDIMFANGEQLLSNPLRQRRKYLKELFGSEKFGHFEYAKEITVEADEACITNEVTLTKMNYFFDDAFRASCEGVMVKLLDVNAGYTPSKRSDAWLKVKRDYIEGLNDSLDLVPIGAWYGNGRKAGWYSPFLMACYNPETEEFQSVCRVMSGFSDSFYTEMKEFYSGERILSKKPLYYRTAEAPDMWFSPELVWEIRGADLTVSPVHHAAIGLIHPSRGISIRFPRFIRSRADRKPEECSTADDIADMFNSQTRKMDVSLAE